MITIDLTLKNTPFPLSVQRKTPEDAETLYQSLVTAMKFGSNDVLELTCDRQPEKKIAVRSTDITAVQVSEKSSTANSGRTPGFFSLTQ